MNILPKKRWHVRTKDNIARVRRDEAKAEQEENEKKERIKKAETEARIQILRDQARRKHVGRSKSPETSSTSTEKLEHINFFAELEEGKNDCKKSNKDYEKEKKEEREKYEKSIGYLTYLGQDSNNITGTSWYNKLPERRSSKDEEIEIDTKRKSLQDPIHAINKHLKSISSNRQDCKSSDKGDMIEKLKRKSSDSDREMSANSKKHKLNKSSKDKLRSVERTPNNSIEQLRAERLLREQTERLRTEALLAKLRGDPIPAVPKEEPKEIFRQKYNSQFFPELARQNVQK